MSERNERWYEADAESGEVHQKLLEYVRAIEQNQIDTFERFLKCASLYDPYDRMGLTGSWFPSKGGPDRQVSENVCASIVDTVAAVISRSLPRFRFMTDGAEWSSQRRAKYLEYYVEGLVKLLGIYELAQEAFKDGEILGTGAVRVDIDEGRVVVERVLVDEIVVDETACRGREPRELFIRRLIDKEELRRKFPDLEDEIDAAQAVESDDGGTGWTRWAGYRPIERDQIVVIEGWRLPSKPGGDDGRHAIGIDGADLLVEPWTKDHFPIARVTWTKRRNGWYGIGLIERIAGHQRMINKTNWQIDLQIDHHAVPTTYVSLADAALAIKTTTRFGTIVPYKGLQPPQTVIPPSVGAEQFKRLEMVKASAFEESGVSRLTASALKPSGVDSGAAMREYKDSTTERFAIQEQAFERFVRDIVLLAIECCKELGDSAPEVVNQVGRKYRRFKWSDVDLGELKVQIAAASNLARTPAGRMQTVLEWAQSGVVSQDEARALMEHPDLERAMSLYTAALRDIERTIEDLLEGELVVPEPYQNLKMGVWRVTQDLLNLRDVAPEPVMEGMRNWINQAAYMIALASTPPMAAPPGQVPAQAPPAAAA